jgi:radical SAM protein with 4Fe4S-binding SPASM domain
MQGNLLVLFLEGLEAATPPGYSARERQQWRSLTRRCLTFNRDGHHTLLSILRAFTSFWDKLILLCQVWKCPRLLDKADMTSPHHHTCGVGQNYLVIDQHGGVAKCQMEMKSTITTVNTDDPLQMIRTDRRDVQGLAVEEKEGCRTCQWRYWCTGGCPIVTYRSTGRYDVKSPNCNIYKTLFPEVLQLEALRLLHYEMPITLTAC